MRRKRPEKSGLFCEKNKGVVSYEFKSSCGYIARVSFGVFLCGYCLGPICIFNAREKCHKKE